MTTTPGETSESRATPAWCRGPVLVGLSCAVVLGGCGGPSPAGTSPSPPALASLPAGSSRLHGLSADRVLAASEAALASASSVHVTEKASASGLDAVIDMRIAAGKGGTGTETIGGKQVKLLRIGDSLYLGGDSSLRQAVVPTGTSAPEGKWVKISARHRVVRWMLGFTDLTRMSKTFEPVGGTRLSLGTPTTIDGKPAVVVVESGAKASGRLYVSAEGEPYPLLIESTVTGGTLVATARFTEYGMPVELSAPAAADVVEGLKS